MLAPCLLSCNIFIHCLLAGFLTSALHLNRSPLPSKKYFPPDLTFSAWFLISFFLQQTSSAQLLPIFHHLCLSPSLNGVCVPNAQLVAQCGRSKVNLRAQISGLSSAFVGCANFRIRVWSSSHLDFLLVFYFINFPDSPRSLSLLSAHIYLSVYHAQLHFISLTSLLLPPLLSPPCFLAQLCS